MSEVMVALAGAYEDRFGEEIPDSFVVGEENMHRLQEFIELALERDAPLRAEDFGRDKPPPEARPFANGGRRVW